jgi:hypothetical protein
MGVRATSDLPARFATSVPNRAAAVQDQGVSGDTDCAEWRKLEKHARAEAAKHPSTAEGRDRIVKAVEAARQDLDGGDVRSHAICFDPEQWQPYASVLPAHVLQAKCISRGDVFELAGKPVGVDANWRLFLASFIWGQGTNGYGKARLERIIDTTPPAHLSVVVAEARARLAACGPLSAYAYLRGTSTACTVPNWGPAFFTKLLYFAHSESAPGSALILDNLTATAVGEISGLLHFVNKRGKSVRWTAYRYGVYLAWMNWMAAEQDVAPDFLEYSLFVAQR